MLCGLRRLFSKSVICLCISEGHSAEMDRHKQAMSGNPVFFCSSWAVLHFLVFVCPIYLKRDGKTVPYLMLVPIILSFPSSKSQSFEATFKKSFAFLLLLSSVWYFSYFFFNCLFLIRALHECKKVKQSQRSVHIVQFAAFSKVRTSFSHLRTFLLKVKAFPCLSCA